MTTLLDVGIYTIPEASRLTGVSPWRIRRWVRGYAFKTKRGRHRSPPVWHGQLEPIERSFALGFLDLIEVRCVDALLEAGVSWATIRRAHDHAQDVLSHSHPFSSNRFATDGQAIFLELREKSDEIELWDIARVQRVFNQIIRPFLKDLEFAEGHIPNRWWPMGKDHGVALDPRRNFGQPTMFNEGVPTLVLARSVKANGSPEEVARWFEISVRSVQEAVEYEQRLAA